MKLKTLFVFLFSITSCHLALAAESELDQYLIKKQIIDQQFKIQKPEQLKSLLSYLSDEDSRTLPLQIDQNTLIEKLRLYPDHVEINGIITTPDFAQFEQNIGESEVKKLLKRNILENCSQIFEHEFQRKNPYFVDIAVNSEQHQYHFKVPNSECHFN